MKGAFVLRPLLAVDGVLALKPKYAVPKVSLMILKLLVCLGFVLFGEQALETSTGGLSL